MTHLIKPKLRNVNVERITYQGEPVFLIQDGLRLTEGVVLLPQELGPFAMLCDGTHTLPEMRATLEVQYGLQLSQQVIEDLVQQFDQALLLEGETFNQTKQQAVAEYRAAPHRKAALAGGGYPDNPQKLRQLLQKYLDDAGELKPLPATSRGIVSPHIDYPRGGPVYAQVWASAADAIREAELVIVLGTDHNGGLGTLTLTPQHYASPLGIMPTDQKLVERLAEVLGPENAFADELHHRGEHSIELVLLWLQYLRGEEPCPMLPVLVGSFHHFMTGQANIETETKFEAFIDVLRHEMTQRRTVVVASGDLAHLGPAFGEDPLDSNDYVQIQIDDDALLENLCQGDATGFLEFMKAGQYQRNVCGLSPFYFTLRLLGETHGQIMGYDRCPADKNDTSFVSVCGLVWA